MTARAAVGAQLQSGGRFVLGLGTGGKPAMAAALGVADRPLHALLREWETIHHALRGIVDRGIHFPLPDGYRPPSMWLTSDDVAKWSAVGHLADGWLTFLTTPEAFLRRYAHLATTTTGLPTVGVRLDVRLLPDLDASVTPCEPVRGSSPAADRSSRRSWHPGATCPSTTSSSGSADRTLCIRFRPSARRGSSRTGSPTENR